MNARQESSPARAQRKPSVRGDARRAELVNAAASLFADRGYRDTSIADVAARVGVTQQSLLYYFGSKNGLLHAVIDQRDGASIKFVQELVSIGGVRALEQLPGYARRNVKNPDLARLFSVLVAENLHPDDPAHDHFVQRYRNLRTLIEQTLADGQANGEFSAAVDAKVKAVEILAFIEGTNVQWLLDPETIDLIAVTEAFAKSLIASLSPAS
jgi:AcrR family transcriptional regulator